MIWLSVQELSVSGTLSEANQKKEIGEPADTRIVKSGSEVLDEEKEQLKEISATEEVRDPGSSFYLIHNS